jgi:putative toxin-antitoxin system antitoxin component (TIGR02293 family)
MKKYAKQKEESQTVKEPTVAYGYKAIDDGGIYRLIDIVNEGIDYKTFSDIFGRFSFTMQEWAGFLHISGKTLSRYQNDQKSFDTLQSERIIQIEMLHSRGEEVFGSRKNFISWLDTENVALGNVVPKELLTTTFGIQLLADELGRIEHGVLA